MDKVGGAGGLKGRGHVISHGDSSLVAQAERWLVLYRMKVMIREDTRRRRTRA